MKLIFIVKYLCCLLLLEIKKRLNRGSAVAQISGEIRAFFNFRVTWIIFFTHFTIAFRLYNSAVITKPQVIQNNLMKIVQFVND